MNIPITEVISWVAKAKNQIINENAQANDIVEYLDWEINHWMDEEGERMAEALNG